MMYALKRCVDRNQQKIITTKMSVTPLNVIPLQSGCHKNYYTLDAIIYHVSAREMKIDLIRNGGN